MSPASRGIQSGAAAGWAPWTRAFAMPGEGVGMAGCCAASPGSVALVYGHGGRCVAAARRGSAAAQEQSLPERTAQPRLLQRCLEHSRCRRLVVSVDQRHSSNKQQSSTRRWRGGGIADVRTTC